MDTMSEKTGGMWHLYWSGGKKDPSLTELLNEKFCYFKLNLPFLPARQISAKVYESLGIPHFCGIVDRTRLFKMYQDSRKPQIPLVETPTGRRNKFFKVRPSPANKGYPLRNLFRKSSVFSTERRDKSTAAVKPKGADTPFRTRKSVTFSQGVRVIDISPNPERKSMRTPSGGSPRPRRDLAEAGTPVPQAIEEPDLRTRQLVPEIHTEQDILPETRPVVRHELEEAHGSAEASVTEYVPEDGLREVQVLAEPRSFTGKDIMNFQPDQEEFNTSSRAGESVIAESLSPEGEPPSALDTSEEILQVVVTDTTITSVGQENFTISEVPLKETQNRNKNPASSEEDASVIEGSVSDPGTDIEISIRTLTNLSLFENATVFRPASVNQSEDVIQNNISEHEKIAEKNKVELFIARDDMYKETSSMSELKNKSPNEEKFENIDLNSSSVEDRNQDSFHQRVEEDQNVFELNINPAEESDEPEKVDNEKEAREHVDFLSASERSFSVQMGAGGDEANKLSIREPQVYTEDHKSPSNDPNEKVSVTENYETSFLRRARIMRYRETDESSLASEGEQLGAVDNNDEPSPIKGNDTLSNTDTMSFLREATSFLDLRDKESPRATGKSHQPCSIAPKRLDFTGEVLRSKGSTMSESLSRDNTVKNVERRPPSEERTDDDHGSPPIPESPRATKKSHQPCSIVPRRHDFTDQVLRSKSSSTSGSLSRGNTVPNVERRLPSEERSDADHGSPLIPESPRATKKSNQPCSIVPRRHDFTDQVLRRKSSSTSGSLSRGNTVPNVESRPPSEERSDADRGSPLIPESPRATKKIDQPCSIVPRRHDFTDEVQRSKSSTTSISLSRDNTVQNVESRPPSEVWSDGDYGSPLIPENVDLNQSTSEFYTSDIIVSPGHIASFEEVSTAYETEKETGRLQLNRYIRKQESEEIKKDVSSSQETEPAPKIEEIPSKIVDGHLEHNNENRLTSLMLDCTSSQETKPASQFLKSIAKNEFDVPQGDLPPERDILSESNSGSSPNRDHEQEIVFDPAQRMGITEVQLNRKELAERYDGIEAADQNNNSATSTHAQKHLKSHTISFLQEWFQSRQVLEELQVNTEPVDSKNTAFESLSIINEAVPEGSTFPRSNSKNNATSRNAVDLIDSKNSDEGILEKIPNSQVNSCSVSIVCNTDSLKTYDRGSVCRKLTELKERKIAEVLIESENNKRELQNESLDDTSKLEDSRNQNAGDSPPKGGSGSEIVESSDESPDLGKTRGRKRKKSRHQRARFLKNRPAVNTVSSSEEDSSYLGGNKRGRHTWHSAFKKNSQAHFLKMKKRLSWHEGFDRKLKTHQSAQKQSTESKKKPPRYKETQHLTNESVLANLDEITPEKRILNENHHNTKQRTEQGDQGNNVPISDLSHVVRAESFELFKEKKLIPSKKADAEKPFQKPKTIREALLYEKWYRSQLGYSVSSERPTEVDTPRSINSGVTHEAETGEVSADASSITSRKKSMSSVDKIREPIKGKLSEVIPGYFSKASELQTQSTTPGGPTLSAVNPTTHTKFIEVSDGINKRKRKLFAEDEAPGVNEKVTNPEHIQLVSARSDKSLELSHCKQTKRHRLLHSDEEKENLATHPENMNPSRSGISSDSMSRNAPFVGRKRVIKSPSTKGKEIEGKDIASTKYQHEGIVEKPKIPAPKSSCVQWHNTANTSSTASNESAALSNLYRRSYFIPSPSPNRSYSKS